MSSETQPKSERNLQKVLAQMQHWGGDFHRSAGEEWANFGTHFLGAVFSIFALTFMCVKTSESGEARKIVSAAIYGTSLFVLYSASSLYHLVSKWRVKAFLQAFDHISIYLLIAGSYTPFALVALRKGPLGIWVLVITWVLALLGIISETLIRPRKEWLAMAITISMGWELLLFFGTLKNSLDMLGFVMLVVGGGLYTGGAIFYALDKVPYMHTVWHCFVLAASICHWVAIQFGVF